MTDIDETKTEFSPTMIGEVVHIVVGLPWPYEIVGVLQSYGRSENKFTFYSLDNETEERVLSGAFTVTRVKEVPLVAAVNEFSYMLANLTTNLTTNLERIIR